MPSVVHVAHITNGADQFDVVVDTMGRCFLNRCEVMRVKKSDFKRYFPQIVGLLVSASCDAKNRKVKVSTDPSYADFLKTLIDTINRSDLIKVQVLEEKPDERVENKPRQLPVCADNLQRYGSQVKTHAKCMDEGLEISGVLLRTQFPPTMWNRRKIEQILGRIRCCGNQICDQNCFERAISRTGMQLGKLVDVVRKKTGASPQFVTAIIDQVVNDFWTMKNMVSAYLLTLYRLYDINPTFGRLTGYPATWFLDPSVFLNFTRNYEDICDSLIDLVRTEASVIRPLLAWRDTLIQ